MREKRTCISLTVLLVTILFAAPLAAREELGDQAIADAIEDAYLVDGAVNVNNIDVSVIEGIAQLNGTVENIMAKERATFIAEKVKGVRAVSNRIDVQLAEPRSDIETNVAVQQALLEDPATESYEVDVAVENGEVTLSGTVGSFGEKQLATKVAKSVRGVVDVKNNIMIDYDTDRPDAEIKPEIEQRLRWDVLVNDGLVDVAVNDGKVTLTGTVGSAAEKRRALWDAWVTGVREVDNSGLEVEWWAKDEDLRSGKYVHKSDAEIEQAIEDAALYDPRVLSTNVDTQVESSWVTLRGNVENLEAKRAAETLARHTVGVAGVTNRLKVRPEEPLGDERIEDRVESALLENPFTDSFQISVNARQGSVSLYGRVDSPFEKSEAATVAAAVRGVTDVNNHLRVADGSLEFHSSLGYPWYTPTLSVPTQLVDDAEIHDQIRDELWWSPFVDSDEVNVSVNRGTATLTGTVDTWREFQAAEENAREGGAYVVVNNLSVE